MKGTMKIDEATVLSKPQAGRQQAEDEGRI